MSEHDDCNSPESESEESSECEVIASQSASEEETSSDSVIEEARNPNLAPEEIEVMYSSDVARPELKDPLLVLRQERKALDPPKFAESNACTNCGITAGTGKIKSLNFTCSRCKVPKYCTKKCLDYDWDRLHRRRCQGGK